MIDHAGALIGTNTARLMGICADCGAPLKFCNCDSNEPTHDSSRERIR